MLKRNENNICHCGRRLHYQDKNIERQITQLVERFGPYINVTEEGNRTFRVQRHYIALHGIRGKDLSKLKFQEVKR